jgi:hypothetical protein
MNGAPQQPTDTEVNLTRAGVSGKIPKSGAASGKPMKAHKVSGNTKKRVRRLKREGLISDKSASRRGL